MPRGPHTGIRGRGLRVLSSLSSREVHAGCGLSIEATRLEESHVSIPRECDQRGRLRGVARVGEGVTVSLEPNSVGLDGVVDACGRHCEGANPLLLLD